MDRIDLILALEGDSLEVITMAQLQELKELANDLRYSQGFYGRLYEYLSEITEEDLPIIL